MLRLFLDDYEVFPDAQASVKLIKENPYFTASGTYTMEMSLPTHILQNRKYFQNIHRLDRKKQVQTVKARLMDANQTIVDGSAVVTNITPEAYKIQIFGGNSEVNFIKKYGDIYIDELEFAPIEWKWEEFWIGDWMANRVDLVKDDGRFIIYPVYDITNDVVCWGGGYWQSHPEWLYEYGGRIMPYLAKVTEEIFANFGYEMKGGILSQNPWNRLIIANAARTYRIGRMLPHWTLAEFITQLQRLFNATILFDDADRTVEIVSNVSYFSTGQKELTNIIDEYQAETADEDEEKTQSVASSNLRYAIDNGSFRVFDYIDPDTLKSFDIKEFESLSALREHINATDVEVACKYIYDVPEGRFCLAKGIDNDAFTDWEGIHEYGLREIDMFGRLTRNLSDEELELKIVPVAMTAGQRNVYNDEPWEFTEDGNWFSQKESSKFLNIPALASTISADSNGKRVWDILTGEEELSDDAKDKSDLMEVMFLASFTDTFHNITETEVRQGVNVEQKYCQKRICFTDKNYNCFGMQGNNKKFPRTYDDWTLNLRDRKRAFRGIADLHKKGIQINNRTEYQIEFVSKQIPDIRKLFIIHNKRFVCKKVEIKIDQKGIDERMKGYFYELL